MGEVYRARDTRLKRDVAIKVLPDAFAQNPERLARFQREAELLATLNHSNIAAVYGLEQTEHLTGIVLELIEGDTLAERLAHSAGLRAHGLPFDEALPIARQIAQALEAAHEKGVIHRDLKPANIKVTADGKVKVLDFGLAKLTDAASGAPLAGGSVHLSLSPTITTPAATLAGVILGTAAYMAPEQAKGRGADKRADIWAFGCVVFEMLTGTRAFEGDDVSDTLANVLKTAPDWAALPATVPTPVRTLLTLCLEKDRGRRMADIAVAQFLLSDAAGVPLTSREIQPIPRGRFSRVLPWAVAATLGIGLALALAVWAPWRRATPSAPMRLNAELGADGALMTDQGAAAVLSPDGALLVFVAQKDATVDPQLYVRRLQQLQAMPLAGTDNARNPFFSPDGQWIAFFADGKLKKISVTGGAAVTLCDVPNGRGGTWAEDGTIIFTPNFGTGTSLLRVSSAGGKPEMLTSLDQGEESQRWPQALPGAKAVLYTGARNLNAWDDASIVVRPLPSGARKVVQTGGYYGRYLPSGHLVYIHDGTLFAAPFDLDRLEVTGQSVPVLEGVIASQGGTGGAQFSVTDSGTLVYSTEQAMSADAPIAWMDRAGKTTSLRAASANWANPQFSPDGRRLAMYINDGKQSDVFIYDWARDQLSRLTFDAGDDTLPAWTPDGLRIAFVALRDGQAPNLYWQRADGTGEVQRLTESKNIQRAPAWHPSGKFLAFQELGGDLMILPIEGNESSGWKPGKPTAFLSSPFNESWPAFSPDGRWLAYQSDESGRAEVYVRPFPGPGGKWQVSAGGGNLPRWSRSRHELLFESNAPDNRIMVAPYAVEGDSFRAEKPRVWAERRFLARPMGWDYDLHPDGERVALAPEPDTPAVVKQEKVVFIFNFFDELRRLAPPKK
jgi:Tol biopolymer transport system component